MCTGTPTFSAQRWHRLDRYKCRNYYSKSQLSAVFSESLGNSGGDRTQLPRAFCQRGTSLKYVVNTHGNIFRLADAEYYILLSARWFKGTTLDGPWAFVNAADIPSDFAKIPTEQ